MMQTEGRAVWRPLMFLLCLVAASSGTPLRQAEAADDIARTLAGSGDSGIEVVAGGVGDDSGETVVDRGGPGHAIADTIPGAALSDRAPAVPDRSAASIARTAATPRPRWAPRRHAWLQRFLF